MRYHDEYLKAKAEVENFPGVFVYNEGETYEHIIYKGYDIYLQENEDPIDENHPGKVIFMVFRIESNGCTHTQVSYWEEYSGPASIDAVLGRKLTPVDHTKPISIGKISNTQAYVIKNVVSRDGGNREKEILKNRYFVIPSDTWNKEHRVAEILLLDAGEDGYHDGFAVDLVTESICG